MAITELARSRRQELDQALKTALEQEDVSSLEVLTEELEDTLPLFRLSEKSQGREGQDVPLKTAVEILESIEETHIPLQEFYIRYKEGVLSQMWEAAGKLDVAMLKPLVHTFRKVKQTEAILAEQPEIVVSREVFLRTLKELFEGPEEEAVGEEREEVIINKEIEESAIQAGLNKRQRNWLEFLATGPLSEEDLGRRYLGNYFETFKLPGILRSLTSTQKKLEQAETPLQLKRDKEKHTWSLVAPTEEPEEPEN